MPHVEGVSLRSRRFRLRHASASKQGIRAIPRPASTAGSMVLRLSVRRATSACGKYSPAHFRYRAVATKQNDRSAFAMPLPVSRLRIDAMAERDDFPADQELRRRWCQPDGQARLTRGEVQLAGVVSSSRSLPGYCRRNAGSAGTGTRLEKSYRAVRRKALSRAAFRANRRRPANGLSSRSGPGIPGAHQ